MTRRSEFIMIWKQRRYTGFFCFNDTATTEIYTLSLHDALPIWHRPPRGRARAGAAVGIAARAAEAAGPRRGDRLRASLRDRKSTPLNSCHANISYADLSLKKKSIPYSLCPFLSSNISPFLVAHL